MAANNILHISIVGFGYVGRQICSLLLSHTAKHLHINVLDPDLTVKGAFKDLAHAAALTKHRMSFNKQDNFIQADFIFHCAGGRVPKGASRLEICAESAKITKQVFKQLQFSKEPFILVVANPVELITYLTQEITQLPRYKVFGTGTLLDSIRMHALLEEEFTNLRNIKTVLLGEHGSTCFISQQLSSIQEESILTFVSESQVDQMLHKVKQAADEIKQTQDATLYGVSHCAIKLFEASLSKEATQLPVSTFTPKNWKFLNQKQLALSLLANISQKGIFPAEHYVPNETESAFIQQSANQLSTCLKGLE